MFLFDHRVFITLKQVVQKKIPRSRPNPKPLNPKHKVPVHAAAGFFGVLAVALCRPDCEVDA